MLTSQAVILRGCTERSPQWIDCKRAFARFQCRHPKAADASGEHLTPAVQQRRLQAPCQAAGAHLSLADTASATGGWRGDELVCRREAIVHSEQIVADQSGIFQAHGWGAVAQDALQR